MPRPNLTRILGRGFPVDERPLVTRAPVAGTPAAIVRNLELRSFDLVGCEGEVQDRREPVGYQGAFDALARRLPQGGLAVEGRLMRVFVRDARTRPWPGLRVVGRC